MKRISLILLGLLMWSEQTAWSQQDVQAVGSNDVLFAKCIKILNYGSDMTLNKPSKTDAVTALGLLGDERAIPVLIDHLQNEENLQIRQQIVKALGWIGGTNVVAGLESVLKDKTPYLRQQAATALKNITGKDYEYDKTGLPDIQRMQYEDRMRLMNRLSSQTSNPSETIANKTNTTATGQ